MKFLLGLMLLCSMCAFGQRRVDVDQNNTTLQNGAFFQSVNGVPVVTNVYFRVVEGSAYFDPEWMKGSVALDSMTEYKDLTLRLDLLKNELHFKNDKGEELICSSPISKITLTDAAGKKYDFRNSFFISALAPMFKPDVWLQEWAQGRASLYTHHKKAVSETRPYGSATLEQRIMTTDAHYLVVNGQAIKVKRVSDIVSALTDKKAELQDWLKKNEVDARDPADLGRVVNAYNSFFPKS